MIENLDVKTADGVADAWGAGPAGGPRVLLYMDVFGLRPALRTMTETYADHGYRVLVPNLFWRVGRAPFADPMAALRAHAPEHFVRDAAAYLDALRPDPVNVVGYCLGGAVALRTAAAYPGRVARVASYHAGRLVTDDPSSPHRLAPRLRAPLHLVHADHDESMPPAAQEALARALREAGCRFGAEVYPGCRHGFTMSDRDVYDAAGTARHWRETFAFFDGEAP